MGLKLDSVSYQDRFGLELVENYFQIIFEQNIKIY